MITVSINRGALEKAILDLNGKIDGAVGPAAKVGSQIFYEQVQENFRMNVQFSRKPHWFYGLASKAAKNNKKSKAYLFDPGTLYNSIYQVYSRDNSSEKRAVFHIAWNHQKAPYGFMVEFGTSRAPAHPFLNPAWSRRGDVAVAVKAKLMELVT